MTYILVYYYPSTGNLYNIVYHDPEEGGMSYTPALVPADPYSIPFHHQAQTLTYGDFTFEMSQFAIQCGDTRYVYDYRPGVSLYVTKDDPNFGEGVNLVFAITFDDELVYWIHMGRNFRETLPEIQWFIYAMGY